MPIFNRSTSNVHLLSWGHYKRCSHSSRIVILAEVQCGLIRAQHAQPSWWRVSGIHLEVSNNTRPGKVIKKSIIKVSFCFGEYAIECHLNKLPKKEPECSYSWFDYDFTFLCFVKPQVSINITLTPPSYQQPVLRKHLLERDRSREI